jgi:hypothetical protein
MSVPCKLIRMGSRYQLLDYMSCFERLIHSLKTTIACIIGFILMQFMGVMGNQWIIITIIVVWYYAL